MPAPFHKDLRQRIIDLYLAGVTRISTLAVHFSVSKDTVSRYISRHNSTGSVDPDPHGGGRPAVIGLEEVDKLATVIGLKPDATIDEMCLTYEKRYGKKVTRSSMHRALARFGITSKKKSLIAIEQTRPDVVEKRKLHAEIQRLVPADNFVFLDETGTNRSMTKREAWAPIGFRAVDFVRGNKGKNVTLIGAVRLSGPVAMRTLENALNKELFSDYIRSALVPKLKAGDVVVMDNCSCHNDKQALDAIEAVGAHVLFLPPYSPDLNPIEMFWNALKRRFERLNVDSVAEIRSALNKAWRSLKNLSLGDLFASSGYTMPPLPI